MVMVSVMQYLAGIIPPLQKSHNVHGIHYATCTRDTIKPHNGWQIMVYGKYSKISKVLKRNVGYQGWNSQNACKSIKWKTVIKLLLQKQSDLGLHCH